VVLVSSLTLIECHRVLIRALSANLLSEAAAVERGARLMRTAEHWVVLDMDAEVAERARRPFPTEPIRTLDAIHLSTAVLAHSLVPDLAVLSLDDRVRRSADRMGFRVVPV
jgi:predicted nucleic acid-binding protein